jgi:hypothetical protein
VRADNAVGGGPDDDTVREQEAHIDINKDRPRRVVVVETRVFDLCLRAADDLDHRVPGEREDSHIDQVDPVRPVESVDGCAVVVRRASGEVEKLEGWVGDPLDMDAAFGAIALKGGNTDECLLLIVAGHVGEGSPDLRVAAVCAASRDDERRRFKVTAAAGSGAAAKERRVGHCGSLPGTADENCAALGRARETEKEGV